MLHWLMVFCFGWICLTWACFVTLAVILALAQRAGKLAPQAPRLAAYFALVLGGLSLLSVSSYWSAFGAPPHHPDLPDLMRLGGIGLYVAVFVVGLKPLRPTLAAFLAANGGTVVAALDAPLWSPRRSLARMAERLTPPR